MRITSTICFHADPAIFGAVRRYVAQFVMLSGGSDEDAAEVELATGELLTNAYCHAYRGMHGPLRVDLSHDGQRIDMSIQDEGEGVAGTVQIPSILAPWSEHRGLYLVGKMSDHVEVTHPRNARGGTTVRLVKQVNKLVALERMLAGQR